MAAHLAHINLSSGGVPKTSVDRAAVGFDGLVGDRQSNRKLHGGPERALCLWSLQLIEMLQREGHPVAVGSTGENLTISGLDWALLAPGVGLSIGVSVLIEVTSYAMPCRTIWHSFRLRRYGRISQKRNPGQSRLYARVLTGGPIGVGDAVIVSAARTV
jgi:MOSC domain-containing protein YiiM